MKKLILISLLLITSICSAYEPIVQDCARGYIYLAKDNTLSNLKSYMDGKKAKCVINAEVTETRVVFSSETLRRIDFYLRYETADSEVSIIENYIVNNLYPNSDVLGYKIWVWWSHNYKPDVYRTIYEK